MALRVLHQGERVVEAHGLVVEQRAHEDRGVVGLQVGARVGDEREAGRVRLGKAVEGEGGDGADDGVRVLAHDPVALHALPKPALDVLHALLRALEAHGAPQLLGFAAGEAGHGHGDPQELLLEERHPERSLQDRLERRVRVGDRLAPVPPVQVGVDHLPHDRPGPDDRDLDHEVVEVVGLHARQGRHLRAALDLEEAHGVGLLEHGVDLGVVGRQVGKVELDPLVGEEVDRVLEGRHHPEAQEVDLHDPEVGAVLLVPLDDHAPRHARGLEGHDAVELSLRDHHAPRVLAEMPRQVLDLVEEPGEELDASVLRVEAGPAQPALEGVARVLVLEAAHEVREPVDLVLGHVEDLADLARGAPVAIGDDVRGHGRAPCPVARVDVLDHALAAVAARQVEVDVGPLAALLGQEALEEQVHPHRIDGGDAQAVADRAVGGRAAALDQDALAPAEVHDVPDDQEVAGELELADERELALDLTARLLVVGPIAVAGPLLRLRLQERELRLPRRDGIVREAVAEILERELEALGQGLVVTEQRGWSAKSAAIARGAFRCRSALSASRRPAVWSFRFSRMHVITSKSARPRDVAWRTPFVATARRPSDPARSRRD